MFCRERYDKIIFELENIIKNFNYLIDNTNLEENLDNNHYELFQHENNLIFFVTKLNHMKLLKNVCIHKINILCVHNFESNTINITPESSNDVTRCKKCGFTK
jgi:hypothetical protein